MALCVIVAERSLYRSNKQSKQTQRRRFIGHAWLGILLLIPPPRLLCVGACTGGDHGELAIFMASTAAAAATATAAATKQISGELPRY